METIRSSRELNPMLATHAGIISAGISLSRFGARIKAAFTHEDVARAVSKFGDRPGSAPAAVAERLVFRFPALARRASSLSAQIARSSTAAMCAALLQPTGGAASGPIHLAASLLSGERFQHRWRRHLRRGLDLHWTRVIAAIDSRIELGGFGFLFLVAADWFATRLCAHGFGKRGGGRLGQLRLSEAQRVALTALDVEHTQTIGAKRSREIARAKAKRRPRNGTPLFIGRPSLRSEGPLRIIASRNSACAAFIENDGLRPAPCALMDGPQNRQCRTRARPFARSGRTGR